MKSSQELAITLKEYAKSKKIPVGKMLSDCGLSINTLSSMRAGGYYPRLEAITKIADYLDCSVDYLLGRADTPGQKKEASIHPLSGQTDAPVVVMGHGGTGGIHVVSSPNPEKLAELYDTLSNFNDDQLQLVIDYAKYLYKSGK